VPTSPSSRTASPRTRHRKEEEEEENKKEKEIERQNRKKEKVRKCGIILTVIISSPSLLFFFFLFFSFFFLRSIPFFFQIPSEPLDAIVIGSGVGGLTCAAVLAQSGQRVLVRAS
jgi:hypothetical protein